MAEREYVSLDIRRKVAQLIFPRLDVADFEANKSEYIALAEQGVGGFCVFNADLAGMRNVVRTLAAHSDIPLLYCCDMEFGLPMRFSDGTPFPRAGAIGRSGNPGNAFIAAKITALEAKSCGIFWNLAPVADVASNPENPIIGLRAFADNPNDTAKFVLAAIKATQEERVMACAKHFPGHGDTAVDSHIEIPTLAKSLDEMTHNELMPFYLAITQEVASIMVGHLTVPALDDSLAPASLSRKIITDFLRKKLKFDGIIVTDALDMKSVENMHPAGGAALEALKAGADVLLMPKSFSDATACIYNHLDEIDAEEILDSFDRIIAQKRRCGLIDGILNSLPENLNFAEHAEIAMRMAKSCLNFSGEQSACTLSEEDTYLLLCVLTDDRHLENALKFSRLLQSRTYNDCDTMFINEGFTDADAAEIEKAADDSVAIIAVFQAPGGYAAKRNVSPELAARINRLSAKKKTILVNFAPPEASGEIVFDEKISASSEDLTTLNAVANLISGSDEPFDFVGDIDVAKYKR